MPVGPPPRHCENQNYLDPAKHPLGAEAPWPRTRAVGYRGGVHREFRISVRAESWEVRWQSDRWGWSIQKIPVTLPASESEATGMNVTEKNWAVPKALFSIICFFEKYYSEGIREDTEMSKRNFWPHFTNIETSHSNEVQNTLEL